MTALALAKMIAAASHCLHVRPWRPLRRSGAWHETHIITVELSRAILNFWRDGYELDMGPITMS
jgi:hypothetical protein